MKYSQLIGTAASLLVIGICFLPWIEVYSLHLMLSGWYGKVDNELNFGQQGISHTLFCLIMIILFQVPRIWAKRTNIFIAALHLGWALKNYLIFSMCRLGECPIVKPALYLLLFLALFIQVMTFLPQLEINEEITMTKEAK
jgi:hypothetical protein